VKKIDQIEMDRIKIKRLWRQVLDIMDRIDIIAESYSQEEIEADIAEAIKAVRDLEQGGAGKGTW